MLTFTERISWCCLFVNYYKWLSFLSGSRWSSKEKAILKRLDSCLFPGIQAKNISVLLIFNPPFLSTWYSWLSLSFRSPPLRSPLSFHSPSLHHFSLGICRSFLTVFLWCVSPGPLIFHTRASYEVLLFPWSPNSVGFHSKPSPICPPFTELTFHTMQ